ncbi:hypothetical protein ACE6H2_015318 [Prunus campanulata]
MEMGLWAEGSPLKSIVSSCSATTVEPSCMCLSAVIGSWKAQGMGVSSPGLLWLSACITSSSPYSGLSRRTRLSPQTRHKRCTMHPSGSVAFEHWG